MTRDTDIARIAAVLRRTNWPIDGHGRYGSVPGGQVNDAASRLYSAGLRPSVEPSNTQPLADLLNRIERHVDHECGADHRYAFMQEVRVMVGDLLPTQASDSPEKTT